jgi:hypothetical protein
MEKTPDCAAAYAFKVSGTARALPFDDCQQYAPHKPSRAAVGIEKAELLGRDALGLEFTQYQPAT